MRRKDPRWDVEPCFTLELQQDFFEKFKDVASNLDPNGKIELRWLINRAYFCGYKNAETDSKG